MNWYLDALKKYAVFNGRARRKEYWMFALFNTIISIVLALVDNILGTSSIISSIYSLAVLIPSIALCVRRLHDVGKSGWWYFLILIPLVGIIWLFILFCTDSKPGNNAYGPNPKGIY